MAREAGVKGKVYVQFVVEKDGSLQISKIIRGIGSGCDEEAKRAVRKCLNGNQAEQRGNQYV